MNKKLDNYLCDVYSRIFVERTKSPLESCLGRGFECGNGWFPIIDALCFQIQRHIDEHNTHEMDKSKHIPQFIALQVKEKFGQLRIYFSGGDDYCKGLVVMAESISAHFCEICGKGGHLYTGRTEGWITTLCGDCAKKLKRKTKPSREMRTLLQRAIKEDAKRYV